MRVRRMPVLRGMRLLRARPLRARSPYRFDVPAVQKALELAGDVRAFGAELLAAYEKGDAEYLACAARQPASASCQQLTLAIRKDQWRDADWQVQALKQAKLSAHNQLAYYTGLVRPAGSTATRILYSDLTGVAVGLQVGAQVFELIAQLGGVIPDAYVGEVNMVRLPSSR